MLVFNRNFIFVDEKNLSVPTTKNVESIIISKDNTFSLANHFRFQSTWVEMTKRRVRYYTNKAFETNQKIDFWAFEIEKVVTLIWDEKSNIITYIEGEKYTPTLLQFWVLHTFFPLVLELGRTHHILHVSAVEVKNKMILFSAFSGGGKSTLTDYFIQKKHVAYGDDTIAINKDGTKYEVTSSYPFHRPYREVEVLGYPIVNFGTEVRPLSHIYSLEKSDADAKIEIIELYGIEKFEAIYQSMFVTFDSMKKEHYLFAIKMAKKIKVFKIVVPWDKSRLQEVYEVIVNHCKI